MQTNVFTKTNKVSSRMRLPFVRPKLPEWRQISRPYEEIIQSGMITTGEHAEELGRQLANHLGVKHAIAVSSCTMGLILGIQALRLPKDTEVILPSFTFMASGLAPVWNNLRPRFVDVNPRSMSIDVEQAKQAITPNTSAIIGVHQFGAPAEVEALEALAQKHGLALLFDSAHGFGSLHHGSPLGCYGRFEAFSLSPTKVLIAGEGGIVATNDDEIAEAVYYGRNYANPGNYDCLFPGLNARMSEFHAILALESFKMLEPAVQHRNWAAAFYKEQLQGVPGISFQEMNPYDRSSYKDFTIVIDEAEFGLTRDQCMQALSDRGIETRVYYQPVLHQMTAFAQYTAGQSLDALTHSIDLSEHALSLPLYSDMSEAEISYVCEALAGIHHEGE